MALFTIQLIAFSSLYKLGLNPGGHNIAIDIIPNEIAADCLTVGTKLLTDETASFAGRNEQRASP